jgi:signal transduction histidine kinase/CheY-like chemotaxis protein
LSETLVRDKLVNKSIDVFVEMVLNKLHMNKTLLANFESDLQIPIEPLLIALFALGAILAILGGNPAYVVFIRPLVIGLWSIALGSWMLEQWRPRAGSWFLCLSLVILIQSLHLGMPLPGAIFLLVIPPVLALPLLGLPSASLIAVGESALLGWAWHLASAEATAILFTLLTIWLLLGILWGIDSRVRHIARWTSAYYERARTMLEQIYQERTEREQMVADLAHANRQLALMNEKLLAARLLAEEAQRAKAAFVANVSHEFRTPLNMIIGLVDLLLETPDIYGGHLPPALLEDLEIVHRNCEHLASMITDVLDLSQIEAGRLALRREQVNLAEVIERAVTLTKPLIEKKGLSLQVTVPPDLPEVYCDRTRIRQVIVNLVSNAARLTERGSICITAQHDANQIIVSVSDTGPGIAPEDAQRIFQPFYRGKASGYAGSGLGLSISKHFVELHDGEMSFESTVGVGSTFRFSLPISPFAPPVTPASALIKDDWVWHERTTPRRLPSEPPRPRILVCDDSSDLSSMLARYSDEFEFAVCSDFAHISQALEECPAQAILLNAPSTSDLCARLEQATQLIPDTPILGCALPAKSAPAWQVGALDYLLKPVMRQHLEQALAKIGKPIQRVLIVDDNADARQLFTRMLHACDDTLQIRTATDGAQALEELRHHPPDVVLLDIVLPDMDGWEVLRIKNQDERLRAIPVIFISAQDPLERPLTSRVVMASMGEGITLNRLLRCIQTLTTLLTQPDSAQPFSDSVATPMPDPMPG